MGNELSSEIRSRLANYVAGDDSLQKFLKWFVPTAWTIDENSGADRLAAEVELRLAEYTSGHLSEPELKAELLALLEGRVVSLQHGVTFEISNQNQPFEVIYVTGRLESPIQELKVLIG